MAVNNGVIKHIIDLKSDTVTVPTEEMVKKIIIFIFIFIFYFFFFLIKILLNILKLKLIK